MGVLNAVVGWLLPRLAPISEYRDAGSTLVHDEDWASVRSIAVIRAYSGHLVL